jgi:transcription initiation factor TFIIIB Brf1 subunit/transcription initiation factor TFIIB
MESNSVPDNEDISSLWEMADMAFEQLRTENKKKQDIKNKSTNNDDEIHKCNHKITSDGVCSLCGLCTDNSMISREAEWNVYKDDSGNYSKNSQRCDTFVDTNPYSVGGTLLPTKRNTLMAKLAIQQTFSHKQKTYWQVSEEFDRVGSILNITDKYLLDKAKKYWHIYMESGKLTRASVRRGLIAACLFYSCTKNNSPIERQEIIKAFGCDTKTLSKGEKVLFEVLNTDKLTYVNVQKEDSNSFIRYCSLLKLPFNVSNTCNDLFIKYKTELQAVTPKSAVGGIIAYVVKYKLNKKIPTKTIISATVDVCTPTLNKVIQLIYDLDNKST